MKLKLGLVLAGTLAMVISGCEKPEQQQTVTESTPQAIPLPASAVQVTSRRKIQPQFRHPGVIEALQEALIRPQVSARLLATKFSAGDIVEEGDLLVELDASEYEAQLDAAKADVLSAQANEQQARTNWKRAEELMPKGYISALDYDKAKASIDVASAGVARAEAQLKKAQLDVDNTRIRAPFSGRISKPRHAVGSLVQPSGQPLFELVQLDPIYASASVDLSIYNTFALRVKELEAQGETLPEVELTLELAGGGAYPYSGRFENWSHHSDDSSGMIKGRALFPNPDGMLLPGQNVTLVGRAMQAFERTMVPQSAVIQDQQGRYVMILDENDTVQRRNIETGARDGADWSVRNGLDEGTRVIVQGGQSLRPGTKVSLKAGN